MVLLVGTASAASEAPMVCDHLPSRWYWLVVVHQLFMLQTGLSMWSDDDGSSPFAHWAVSWVDLLVLLVIPGREVWQWLGAGNIFIPLSMSQSAETCPCLWSLLCLVYSAASLAANLQGEVANVVASVSSSYPAGRKMLVVGPTGLSCCMNYQHELRAGEVVKCASRKSNSTPSKMKLKWSVARVIIWSWENGDTLKEALQPKHCSAGWFPDR